MAKGSLLADLMELRLAVMQHCVGMKQAIGLREEVGEEAGWARVEGCIAALEASSRAQCVGVKYRCPECRHESPILEWVGDDGKCPKCGYDTNSEE